MVGRTLSPLQTFKLEAWWIELGPSPVLLGETQLPLPELLPELWVRQDPRRQLLALPCGLVGLDLTSLTLTIDRAELPRSDSRWSSPRHRLVSLVELVREIPYTATHSGCIFSLGRREAFEKGYFMLCSERVLPLIAPPLVIAGFRGDCAHSMERRDGKAHR